jgi:hypothetical protein
MSPSCQDTAIPAYAAASLYAPCGLFNAEHANHAQAATLTPLLPAVCCAAGRRPLAAAFPPFPVLNTAVPLLQPALLTAFCGLPSCCTDHAYCFMNLIYITNPCYINQVLPANGPPALSASVCMPSHA